MINVGPKHCSKESAYLFGMQLSSKHFLCKLYVLYASWAVTGITDNQLHHANTCVCNAEISVLVIENV